MKPIIPVFFFIGLALSCSAGGDNINTEISSNVAVPSPTISTEKQAKETLQNKQDQANSIDAFVSTHYKGWILKGTEDNFGEGCFPDSPCAIHLAKKAETKVVSVVIKLFRSNNGGLYWLVFEARAIDFKSE